MASLDLESVRRVANQTGCREVSFNPKVRAILLRTRSDNLYVHVYYDVGTVLVTVEHPRQGLTQGVKYGVDLSDLSDILNHPLDKIGCGYSRHPTATISTSLADEETALKNYLETLKREAAFIDKEKEDLESRIANAGFNLYTGPIPLSGHRGNKDKFGPYDSIGRSDLQYKGPSSSTFLASEPEGSDAGEGNEVDSAIETLIKQQSDVNAQLERLLVSRKKGAKNRSVSRNRQLSRSASVKRGPSASNSKLTKAAPNDSPGPEDSNDKRKMPFRAMKSTCQPNNQSGSTSGTTHMTAAFRQRGNQCCYALCKPEYHKQFGAAWSAKPANVVALGRGYVILYDDGSVTWWDVPELLDDKLKEQGTSAQAVRYLCMGCDENYYVKFVDGKMEWCGPDSFGSALRHGIQKSRLLVDKVAFGPNQAWLILWSDGRVEYERISTTLETLLKEKPDDSHVKDISMGPNEEWFVIFRDNSVRADNLPDSLYRILSEIQDSGGRVRQVIFGENSAWYVRYWDGKI